MHLLRLLLTLTLQILLNTLLLTCLGSRLIPQSLIQAAGSLHHLTSPLGTCGALLTQLLFRFTHSFLLSRFSGRALLRRGCLLLSRLRGCFRRD